MLVRMKRVRFGGDVASVFGRDLVQGAPCGQNGMGWGMVVYVLMVPRVRGEAVAGFGW